MTAAASLSAAQPSKAAAKRARKKAARQAAADQADAVGAGRPREGDDGATATCIGAAAQSQRQAAQTSAAADAPLGQQQAAAQPAAEPPAEAVTISERAEEVQQQTAASSTVEADWRRCPLSGQVMRHPVVFDGGDGRSFEREAAEAWRRDHPGVAPVTLQQLPPGSCLLDNHMLRQLIQRMAG